MANLTNVAKNVGKLIGGLAKSIKNNKKLYAVGAGGVGGGYIGARLTDNHTKDDHGRKKTASATIKVFDKLVGKQYKDLGLVMNKSPLLIFKLKLRKQNKWDLLENTTKDLTDLNRLSSRTKVGADMTLKEKADQKYAIAKSYEREGHPIKAKEYKNKAGNAYKRAWEIKNKK